MPEKILSKEFLKFAKTPLILLAIFSALLILYRLLDLPSDAEILDFMRRSYEEYGYLVVFIGALIEGGLLINWYLPGSIVIVFGVVFAKGDPLKAVIMVGLVILAFFITTIFNYALGKYGWYRLLLRFGLEKPLEDFRKKVESKGLPIIFSTYIHPNLGALTATSAGILHLPFKKFALYSIAALIMWNTIWGFVAYFTGPVLLDYVNTKTILVLLALWLLYMGVRYMMGKKEPKHVSIP